MALAPGTRLRSASEFVGNYGGLYVTSGVQDVEPETGPSVPGGAMIRVIG